VRSVSAIVADGHHVAARELREAPGISPRGAWGKDSRIYRSDLVMIRAAVKRGYFPESMRVRRRLVRLIIRAQEVMSAGTGFCDSINGVFLQLDKALDWLQLDVLSS
jgi:hypothetical protein